MADKSRRPTRRQKTPISMGTTPVAGVESAPKAKKKIAFPKPKKAAVPKAPKVAAPKAPKAAAPKAPKASGSSRPAFLERATRRTPAAANRPATGREQRERHQRAATAKLVVRALSCVAALALVALVAYLVLRNSSAFVIESVEVEPTEHVSSEDLGKLVQVPAGSTLLNVDTAAIESAMKTDPWVESVSFELVFPHTLKLTVNEQRPAALVVMSSGSVAWYLSDSGTWIQPTKLSPAEGQSVNDAALQIALAEGVLLVTDVPASVQPEAGSAATDEALAAVQAFQDGFSDEFSAQVVRYSAPSADAVSCTLESGVEVLLGTAEDIAKKEQIIEAYLEQHPGSAVSINVRVVSNPSVRPVGSDNIQAGGGVTADELEGSADASGEASGDTGE